MCNLLLIKKKLHHVTFFKVTGFNLLENNVEVLKLSLGQNHEIIAFSTMQDVGEWT